MGSTERKCDGLKEDNSDEKIKGSLVGTSDDVKSGLF